jgi:hypothetical protein
MFLRRRSSLDRAEARFCRRDLHVEVRLGNPGVQPAGLGDARVSVIGEGRVDLPEDVTVDTVACVLGLT